MAPSLEARTARAAGGAASTNQAEIDLSSPLFNAARYLAVTHAVLYAAAPMVLYCG